MRIRRDDRGLYGICDGAKCRPLVDELHQNVFGGVDNRYRDTYETNVRRDTKRLTKVADQGISQFFEGEHPKATHWSQTSLVHVYGDTRSEIWFRHERTEEQGKGLR